MLRLTLASQNAEQVLLQVDGWLAGENVELLEQEGKRYLGQGKRLVLDLEDTRFIDRAGIALLQEWSGEQLMLRNGSLFVRELLKAYDLDQGRS